MDFMDVSVLFGQYDTDVIFEYTLGIAFFVDDESNRELLYDELHLITSADITTEDDVMDIRILNNKLSTDSNISHRQMPRRESMGMTEGDYAEFVSTFGFMLNHLKRWLNDDVFSKGWPFPFSMDEFATSVTFKEKSFHMMLEVEEDAAKFFEDDFGYGYDYYN